jgi:prepilin-type processing-associated H-X9-DG protein
MNNTKQLLLAWKLYADDYRGNLPPNEDNSDGGWIRGNMDYSGGEANTNTLYLLDPRYAKLGPYTRNAGIYKCPADQSRSLGRRGLPRVRSIAMSQAIGPDLRGTANPPRGQWLPHPPYRVYIKESDLTDPAPANLWVFVDEHPDSINDGGFGVSMTGSSWVDVPAKYHNDAAGFAFADGHSEIHKWRQPRGIPNVTYQGLTGLINVPNNPDIKWIQERTSAK